MWLKTFMMTLLDYIVVALNDDEHIINPDAEHEEGDDSVHGAEDKVQARADPITGEQTKIAAADTNRGESRLGMIHIKQISGRHDSSKQTRYFFKSMFQIQKQAWHGRISSGRMHF